VRTHSFVPTFGNPRDSLQHSTLRNWLMNGPSFHDNFHDPGWTQYKSDARRLLSDSASRRWLDQPINNLLTPELEGHVSPQRENTLGDPQGGIPHRGCRRQADDAEAQNRARSVQEVPTRYHRTRRCLYVRLFAALAPVVCILNIFSALGSVILMNYPADPNDGYIIGSVSHFFVTPV
jgi:hypothetical protein